MKAQVPIFYEKEILKTQNNYCKASIGYGKKFDLFDEKQKKDISPGPKYNMNDAISIGKRSALDRSEDGKML